MFHAWMIHKALKLNRISEEDIANIFATKLTIETSEEGLSVIAELFRNTSPSSPDNGAEDHPTINEKD